jgi:hypothetical protein
MTPCRLVDGYQCFRGTEAGNMFLQNIGTHLQCHNFYHAPLKLKASKYKFIYKICTGGHNTTFNTTVTRGNQFFIYLMFLNQLQVLQNIKGAKTIETGEQVMIWKVLMFYPNIYLDRLRKTIKKYRGKEKRNEEIMKEREEAI